MDSISANIAEGFGRYHKKEKYIFTDKALVRPKNQGTGQGKQVPENFFPRLKSPILWANWISYQKLSVS
ncbi:MAG: hypothetical protein H6577_16780 [Lewinellaceae bacterium]|nr:hypothetical protein [Saprospiraceae bacterium]MCB9339781.1 hypothetical protein [Lewinellaceae bacterium]